MTPSETLADLQKHAESLLADIRRSQQMLGGHFLFRKDGSLYFERRRWRIAIALMHDWLIALRDFPADWVFWHVQCPAPGTIWERIFG